MSNLSCWKSHVAAQMCSIAYSEDPDEMPHDAQADLRLCWSHIPHCWKSHVAVQMCSLANSKDPDEMLHDVAFHQGLHSLLRQKKKKNNFIWKL